MGKFLFGVGQFNEGVGKLNRGVGVFQSEVGKLDFTHDPRHFHPLPLTHASMSVS